MNEQIMTLDQFTAYLMKVGKFLKKMPLQTFVQRFLQLPGEYNSYQKKISNRPNMYHFGTDGFDFMAQSYKDHPVKSMLDGAPLVRVQYYLHNNNIVIDLWIIDSTKGSGNGSDCIGMGKRYFIADEASSAPLHEVLTDLAIMKPFIDSLYTGEDK